MQLNGSILISAGADGEIRLWSLEDFGCLKDFVAHGNAVTSLQSNGEVIVSGGSDGMAKVWSRMSISLPVSPPTRIMVSSIAANSRTNSSCSEYRRSDGRDRERRRSLESWHD